MTEYEYTCLVAGEPIHVSGIGSVKSPKLKELKQSSDIGFLTYQFYLSFLLWNKDKLFKYLGVLDFPQIEALKNEKLTLFDIITLVDPTRDILTNVLSLFFIEEPVWDNRKRSFIMRKNTKDGTAGSPVGVISRDNYEDARKIILEANYIGLDEKPKEIKHSSEKARILWERVQKYQDEHKLQDSESEKYGRYTLGNVISKLCVISHGYNLLNVFDLTVFQLYDQFFQCDFMRVRDLEKNVFCYHGGDNFDLQKWQDPMIKFWKESGEENNDKGE